MLDWIARAILVMAGVVAGWFVPRDAEGFIVIQVLVFLLGIAAAALMGIYLPAIIRRFR